MRAEGAFRDSVELLRITWEKYRAVLDDDMIEPLRTATSLAVSLRKAGDQAEAMRLAQDTYNGTNAGTAVESPEAHLRAESRLRLRGRGRARAGTRPGA